MTPTPTSAVVFLPPVIDTIAKRYKCRQGSFGGPAYVIEERKKSASMVSLLLDENGNERQIKSKSMIHAKQSWYDDLALHSQPYRHSDNNHKKKELSVFDYARILRDERKEFSFRLRNSPPATGRLQDFLVMKELANGRYGRVHLAEDVIDKKKRAIKVISKDVTNPISLAKDVQSERNYLYASNSPFIVSLIQHFEDERNFYLVQEYVGNGDLYEHLKYTGPFSEDLTRFYAAQLVLALEYLHNVNLIYRDLKPENVMVEQNGYIKLVDFGLVKRVEQKTTSSVVGTAAYIAPEMILYKPYDKNVDWWSYGILVYEMLAGCQVTPFKDPDELQMFHNIVSKEVTFPASYKFPHSPVRDFIKRLLKRNSSMRLGNGINGSAAVKSHPWFASMKWDELYRRSLAPPIKRGTFVFAKSNFAISTNNQAVPVVVGHSNKVGALKESLLGGKGTMAASRKQMDTIQNRIRFEKLLKMR